MTYRFGCPGLEHDHSVQLYFWDKCAFQSNYGVLFFPQFYVILNRNYFDVIGCRICKDFLVTVSHFFSGGPYSFFIQNRIIVWTDYLATM